MPEAAWPEGMPETHSVYQLVSNGEVVYVGVTNNLKLRLLSHSRRFEFDTVKWEDYMTRGEAELEEERLIGALNPEYNIQGRTDRTWVEGVAARVR